MNQEEITKEKLNIISAVEKYTKIAFDQPTNPEAVTLLHRISEIISGALDRYQYLLELEVRLRRE